MLKDILWALLGIGTVCIAGKVIHEAVKQPPTVVIVNPNPPDNSPPAKS